MACRSVRCVQHQTLDFAAAFVRRMGLCGIGRKAPVGIANHFVRRFLVVGLVLFAGEALAQEALDLDGKWKGSDRKTHRIKVYGFNKILLCRPVAGVGGGIRAYRGKFAKRGFELVSKPRTIGELNNKLPAALRRDLLRLGASYSAKVKIAGGGRKLIVQYIGGTVTWSRSDPAKAHSIKKIPGDKVTLTLVITKKSTLEIATRKAKRAIASLDYQNREWAEYAYSAISKYLWALDNERWITAEERGAFNHHARRIAGLSSLELPQSQLFNLKRHYRWAMDYDTGREIRNPSGRRQHADAKIQEIMPKVRKQLRWLRGLLRAEVTLLKLRDALPDAAAASNGLRDMKKMNKFFWDSNRTGKLIKSNDYATFVRWYSRLKPELAVIVKSKTVAKPTVTPRERPVVAPKC